MVEGIELEETRKFIDNNNNNAHDVEVAIRDGSSHKKQLAEFTGLSKDEVIKYGSDPAWVKARWALFVSFWLAWIGLVVGAVLIVYFTPSCPHIEKLEWYQNEIFYRLNVDKFRDSNSDGKGDLKGIEQKLDHFDSIGVKSILINHVLSDDGKSVKPEYGDENSLLSLKKALEDKDMHLVMKVPANKVKENLESLLKNLVNGILITDIGDYEGKLDELLKDVKKIADTISKKTFKKRFVGVEVSDKSKYESVQQADLIIDHELDNIDDSLNNHNELLAKLNTLYTSKQWKTLSFSSEKCSGIDEEKAQFKKILLLFLRGTPIFKAGDEVNLKEECEYMKWDAKQPNCGFTEAANFEPKLNCSKTVKEQDSTGIGETFYKNLRYLASLRKHYSLQFGNVEFSHNETDSFSFVREAKGFHGYLIATNTGTKKSIRDYSRSFKTELPSNGKVVFSSSNNPDFARDAKISLENIYLREGEILIVEFDRNLKEDQEAKASSGPH